VPLPPQVPGLPKARRVVLFAHTAAGGVVQVTLAHGSVLQAPLLQPLLHVVSVGAEVHVPPEQEPDEA